MRVKLWLLAGVPVVLAACSSPSVLRPGADAQAGCATLAAPIEKPVSVAENATLPEFFDVVERTPSPDAPPVSVAVRSPPASETPVRSPEFQVVITTSYN